jgi:glycine betaine/choline ABC-type transport system substrate-binding protein
MRPRKPLALLAVLLLVCAGCGRARLRVGSKDFTENVLLAEMVALTAEEKGIRVERKIPFGQSFDCLRALEEGELDVYPEYTGTYLALEGATPETDPTKAWTESRKLAKKNGLAWGDPFGFDSRFTLFVRDDLARNEKIRSISDLKKLNREIRFGRSREFDARPIDGMTLLLKRYGLKASPQGIVSDDRDELAKALQGGSLDVVVGDSTSWQAAEYGWEGLKDDKGFFPAYEAAPLARAAALNEHPQLAGVFLALKGKVNQATIRELVKEVDVYGVSPREAARRFLVKQGILKEKKEQGVGQRALHLAVPPEMAAIDKGHQRSRLLNVAVQAVRKANAGRPVKVVEPEEVEAEDVKAAVADGEALLGVMGAEDFFTIPGLHRTRRVEAVAVLGYHVAHVLCVADRAGDGFATVKRLGVSSEKTGQLFQEMFDNVQEVVPGEPSQQLEALRDGDLDAVLVMAEEGSPWVRAALQKPNDGKAKALTLLSLTGGEADEGDLDRRARRFPFLRRVVIPEGTYPTVDRPIQTVGAQVVLAGAVAPEGGLGDGGPSGAVRAELPGIPLTQKRALREAVGVGVEIDPTLPGHDAIPDTTTLPLNPAPWASVLTLVFFALAGYFLWVLARTRPST